MKRGQPVEGRVPPRVPQFLVFFLSSCLSHILVIFSRSPCSRKIRKYNWQFLFVFSFFSLHAFSTKNGSVADAGAGAGAGYAGAEAGGCC